MSTSHPHLTGDLAIPSPEQATLIRRHLKQVLASHAFAGSKRTQNFLELIVNHALEGEFDQLRERMIGAEMFGRPVGYDTGSDSVVRVKATDLRKKLAQYYAEDKEQPDVRIDLPSGSYVPRFHFEPPRTASKDAGAQTQSIALQDGIAHPQPVVAVSRVTDMGVAGSPAGTARRSGRLVASIVLALIVIAAIGFAGYRKWLSSARPGSQIRSIAILPLKNLSGDASQEYFADGMTEELINDLGQVSTLRVISLTSAMSYKGTNKNLPEIAHELAVDGVVEGGVLRAGNKVQISAQLIDARSDRPVWARTYERDFTSGHAWQGEVAQAIADEISINVTPQEQARLARNRPIDPEAQDLYLRGLLQLEADDCKSAVEYFNKAIDKNPNYAQAHAALANCYGRMGESGRMAYKDAFSKQKAEATRAIELDDSLPEGHAELANTAMTLDWDWATAAAEFHRALELDPNSAPIHQKYAFYLVRTGHLPEALAEVERGVDLDPVSWHSFHYEGFVYYFSGQYDQALSLILRVRALDIKPPDWSFLLGDVYAEKGRYPEAISQFIKSGNGPDSLGHLGNAYARAGRPAEARRTISQLQEDVRRNGVGRYEIALVYAGLGEKQEAFSWLEQAYNAHDVGLMYLKIDPCLDTLRSDARFDDLVRRVGLAR
jgi:TolB-like protein/Flp pilus assembly protein TadD